MVMGTMGAGVMLGHVLFHGGLVGTSVGIHKHHKNKMEKDDFTMAFTLNQFKAALNGKAAAADLTANLVPSAQDMMSQAWASTKSATAKTGSAVKRSLPVTSGRFEDMVSAMNEKHNNLERDAWKNKFRIAMVAQATGLNLPSDEELDVLYEQHLEEELEAAKAAQKAAAEPQNIVETVLNVLTESLSELILKASEPAVKVQEVEDTDGGVYEIPEVKEEVVEEEKAPTSEKELKEYRRKVAEKEAAKKEATKAQAPKKSGRKKLGRQAPLAD